MRIQLVHVHILVSVYFGEVFEVHEAILLWWPPNPEKRFLLCNRTSRVRSPAVLHGENSGTFTPTKVTLIRSKPPSQAVWFDSPKICPDDFSTH